MYCVFILVSVGTLGGFHAFLLCKNQTTREFIKSSVPPGKGAGCSRCREVFCTATPSYLEMIGRKGGASARQLRHTFLPLLVLPCDPPLVRAIQGSPDVHAARRNAGRRVLLFRRRGPGRAARGERGGVERSGQGHQQLRQLGGLRGGAPRRGRAARREGAPGRASSRSWERSAGPEAGGAGAGVAAAQPSAENQHGHAAPGPAAAPPPRQVRARARAPAPEGAERAHGCTPRLKRCAARAGARASAGRGRAWGRGARVLRASGSCGRAGGGRAGSSRGLGGRAARILGGRHTQPPPQAGAARTAAPGHRCTRGGAGRGPDRVQERGSGGRAGSGLERMRSSSRGRPRLARPGSRGAPCGADARQRLCRARHDPGAWYVNVLAGLSCTARHTAVLLAQLSPGGASGGETHFNTYTSSTRLTQEPARRSSQPPTSPGPAVPLPRPRSPDALWPCGSPRTRPSASPALGEAPQSVRAPRSSVHPDAALVRCPTGSAVPAPRFQPPPGFRRRREGAQGR